MGNYNPEIDETVLRRMQNRVYKLERDNLKTKQLNDKEMKEEIISIIKQELKKCY